MVAQGAEKRPKISNTRETDPYLDRRSGDDRRQYYMPAYFNKNRPERRAAKERRINVERRKGCARVSTWASICDVASR